MGFWNKLFKKKKDTEPEAKHPVIIKEEKIEVKLEEKKAVEKPTTPLKDDTESATKKSEKKSPAAKKTTKKN